MSLIEQFVQQMSTDFFECLVDILCQRHPTITEEKCWNILGRMSIKRTRPKKKKQTKKTNAYIEFMKEQHAILKTAFPVFGERSREIGRLWREHKEHLNRNGLVHSDDVTNSGSEDHDVATVVSGSEDHDVATVVSGSEDHDVATVVDGSTDVEEEVVTNEPDHKKESLMMKLERLKQMDERDTEQLPHKQKINDEIRDKYRHDAFFKTCMETYSHKYLCFILTDRAQDEDIDLPKNIETMSKEEIVAFYVELERRDKILMEKRIREKVYRARMDPPDHVESWYDHPIAIMYGHLTNRQMLDLLKARFPTDRSTFDEDMRDRTDALLHFIHLYEVERLQEHIPYKSHFMYHNMKNRKLEERVEMLKINFPGFEDSFWMEMEEEEMLRFCVDHAHGLTNDPFYKPPSTKKKDGSKRMKRIKERCLD